MIVVVVVPDFDCLASLLLGCVGAGVEAFIGQEPVVALNLAVVSGRVGADALVTTDERLDRALECCGGVVAAVVGDQPGDAGDAVSGEVCSGSVEEPDRGCGGFVF